MKKQLLTISLSFAMSLLPITAYAGQWKQDTVGWWYQNDDTTYISSNWLNENGTWYYFDSNGYMVTGWLHFTDTDVYYYFNSDGSMRTEPLTENGITYTFDESGAWNNRQQSDEIEQIYDNEAARIGVEYGYSSGTSTGGLHKVPGVNLADENVVYYNNIAQK